MQQGADDRYYRWLENQILDDRSFVTVVASFPVVEGWIDTDKNNDRNLPDYSAAALNALSIAVVQRLEAAGLHGMVYARQLWGEIAELFQHPNSVIVAVLNPFSAFDDAIDGGAVYGGSPDDRLADIQGLLDQLVGTDDNWIFNLQSDFHGLIIRLVQESFDTIFRQTKGQMLRPEISLPDWGGFKRNMIEVVTCHNLNLYTTGLIREIYEAYLAHIYATGFDAIHFADDIPKFAYVALNSFLPVWEILRGLASFDAEGAATLKPQ